MKSGALFTLVWAAALGMVGACSSHPTDLEICHADCDKRHQCGDSDVMTANCNTTCDNNAGNHQQFDINLANTCSNPGAVEDAQMNCINQYACDSVAVLGCQYVSVPANTCVKK
jgi:hypothetical protein